METFSRPMRTTRTVKDLAQVHRLPWYRITNQASGPALVSLFNEIGGPYGVSANDFMTELAQQPGDIELHLNSPGGDVFDGIAIYNTLKQRSGTVAVVVDGLAASAASFIAQAASPGHLKMAPHTQMMIHDGFGAALGNAADMRQMADLLDKASDNIAGIYADRTGKPAAHWREQMKNEVWFSDAEAVAAGLADGVLGQDASENAWDLSVYNGPKIANAEKYNTDDRKQMAAAGEAMADGSYPIRDAEDLHNAIHAVGRGSGDHNAIRKHIIERAAALKLSSAIPDNWNSDGSVDDSSTNLIDPGLLASVFTSALEGGKAA